MYNMKKQYLVLSLFLFLSFTACQEDIAVTPAPPQEETDEEDNNDDNQGIDEQYQACLSPLDSLTLDIVTWNLQFYPKSGAVTESHVFDIVKNSQVDIIGIQEIESWSAMNDLADELGGWEAVVTDVRGSQDLGFLYKTSEIEVLEAPVRIYPNNRTPFPREPVVMKVRHKPTGLETVLINIHLKCCGGSDNEARRIEASRLLKEYVDENYPNEAVIILGDWNDDIYETNGVNSFQNFMDDEANYRFADRSVAEGPISGWSYPSFPSHIDHLLITDELFDNFVSSKTLTVNECLNTYYSTVADHRPVVLRLEGDL